MACSHRLPSIDGQFTMTLMGASKDSFGGTVITKRSPDGSTAKPPQSLWLVACVNSSRRTLARSPLGDAGRWTAMKWSPLLANTTLLPLSIQIGPTPLVVDSLIRVPVGGNG